MNNMAVFFIFDGLLCIICFWLARHKIQAEFIKAMARRRHRLGKDDEAVK